MSISASAGIASTRPSKPSASGSPVTSYVWNATTVARALAPSDWVVRAPRRARKLSDGEDAVPRGRRGRVRRGRGRGRGWCAGHRERVERGAGCAARGARRAGWIRHLDHVCRRAPGRGPPGPRAARAVLGGQAREACFPQRVMVAGFSSILRAGSRRPGGLGHLWLSPDGEHESRSRPAASRSACARLGLLGPHTGHWLPSGAVVASR